VLRQTVDTGLYQIDSVTGYQGNLVVAGILRNSKVSGADSNAITTLAARTDTVLDTFHF
jgi:hypothetical protein